MTSAVVTDTITVSAVYDGCPGKVTVKLRYEPDDPYAIHMLFPEDERGPHGWEFARSLLAAGIQEHTGSGDVRVWPGTRTWPRPPKLLHILLSGEDGRIELLFPYPLVRDFLHQTFDAVPAGREAAFLDVDRAIAHLLEDA